MSMRNLFYLSVRNENFNWNLVNIFRFFIQLEPKWELSLLARGRGQQEVVVGGCQSVRSPIV